MPIEEKLKNLPARPGVYIMRGRNNVVLYIGKAKDIKNRVRSYFR
ncbi:MAG: GIY-YIG nuclease family protein, partial [Deltaproteobacteria bacterium]|nr:GIY-YIG nuclease family protein [Deltaproteobacteria bacterium]